MKQRNAMDVATPAVQDFFDEYARSRSTMDIDRLVAQYADSCMFAPADGPRVAEKQALLEGFPKALELLKTVGHTSTKVASLDETRVDEHYAMVRAQFVWRFEKATEPPIDVAVDSTFILYLKDGVRKIVFHHELEDFWQVLRARGVLPLQV
jgi:ketosteroid isomerase-like protein